MAQEPLWWTKARELRAKGLSPAAVGRICGGKDRTSVIYATDPIFRERRRETNRQRTREHTRKHGRRERDTCRDSVTRAANEEARATGEHVDIILKRWGAPMRYEARP